MSYTPALRDAFARSGAMAYQFILKARPAARQHSPLVEMVEKPLEVMQRLHATRLGEPRDAGLRVLQVVDQFPPGDVTAPGAYCADLVFALARRGHAVRVLSTARVREDVGTTMELDGELAIVVDRVAATRTYRTLGTVGRFFEVSTTRRRGPWSAGCSTRCSPTWSTSINWGRSPPISFPSAATAASRGW